MSQKEHLGAFSGNRRQRKMTYKYNKIRRAAIGFCDYCKLPIYDSAIINHCLFRGEKYNPKITFMRKEND
jgi:hypothetical protein